MVKTSKQNFVFRYRNSILNDWVLRSTLPIKYAILISRLIKLLRVEGNLKNQYESTH